MTRSKGAQEFVGVLLIVGMWVLLFTPILWPPALAIWLLYLAVRGLKRLFKPRYSPVSEAEAVLARLS